MTQPAFCQVAAVAASESSVVFPPSIGIRIEEPVVLVHRQPGKASSLHYLPSLSLVPASRVWKPVVGCAATEECEKKPAVAVAVVPTFAMGQRYFLKQIE